MNDDAEDEAEYDSDDEDYDSDAESVDSVEAELDSFGELWWMKHGEVKHWSEHPYTREAHDRFAIDDPRRLYGKITVHELRRAVRDRGLTDPYPQGLTIKYYYIRTLWIADQNPRFRFLDLPPEMRNLVYSHLLTVRLHCSCCQDWFCYPEILRTCRQINHEAKDILYAENEITCVFGITAFHSWDYTMHARVHTVEYSKKDASHLAHYDKAVGMYPAFLRKVHRLKIKLCMHGNDDGLLRACAGIRRYLMGLASFLMDAHRVQTLSVTLCNHAGADEEDVENMLYPLRRLRGVSGSIEFPNELSDSCADAMRAEMGGLGTRVFNTLRHLQSLKGEAEAYLGIANMCNPSLRPYDRDDMEDMPDQSDLRGRVEHLLFLLDTGDAFIDQDEDPFSTSEEEENTRRLMRDLRAILRRFDAAACLKKLNAFIQYKDGRSKFLAEHAWEDVPDKPYDVALCQETCARDRFLDDMSEE